MWARKGRVFHSLRSALDCVKLWCFGRGSTIDLIGPILPSQSADLIEFYNSITLASDMAKCPLKWQRVFAKRKYLPCDLELHKDNVSQLLIYLLRPADTIAGDELRNIPFLWMKFEKEITSHAGPIMRILKNLDEFGRIRTVLNEFEQNLLEFEQDLLEFEQFLRIFPNLFGFVRICPNLSRFARICLNSRNNLFKLLPFR